MIPYRIYTYDMQTKCANTVDEILLSQRERESPAHVNKIICEAPCVPGCCCYGDVISMSLSVGSVLLFLSMPISAFTYATYHCTPLSDTTSGGWWKVPISARVWWMDGWIVGGTGEGLMYAYILNGWINRHPCI